MNFEVKSGYWLRIHFEIVILIVNWYWFVNIGSKLLFRKYLLKTIGSKILVRKYWFENTGSKILVRIKSRFLQYQCNKSENFENTRSIKSSIPFKTSNMLIYYVFVLTSLRSCVFTKIIQICVFTNFTIFIERLSSKHIMSDSIPYFGNFLRIVNTVFELVSLYKNY